MITFDTIQVIATELAKANPRRWFPLDNVTAFHMQLRSQWETDCLAVANAFPLTGSAVENTIRRQQFLDWCGLNQSLLR